MKKLLFLIVFLFVAIVAYPQFEQKVSINLSAGMFKTFGKKHGYREDGEARPKQMPSYKAGIVSELGIQYNINRRLCLMAELGIMYANKWELIEDSGYNWMHWENFDGEVFVSEGFNNLTLFNLSIGIKPKLYILPGKKLNPFIFTGININYTHSKYIDNQWDDYVAHGLNDPEDTPYNPWLQKNVGFGFNPGLGLEYSPIEKLSIFLNGSYYHIFMNEKNFVSYYEPETVSDFNAFLIQAGIRYSFIKSKKL